MQESPEFVISMVSSVIDSFDSLANKLGLVRVKLIGALRLPPPRL